MTDDALLDAVRTAAKALVAAGFKVSYHTIRRHDPHIRARYGRIWAALDRLIKDGEIPAESRSRRGERGERGRFAPVEMPVVPAARPKPTRRKRGAYTSAMEHIFGEDWRRMYRGTV